MRLAATNIRDCRRMHGGIWRGRAPGRLPAVTPEVTGSSSLSCISGAAPDCQITRQRMYVLRQLTKRKSMGHLTTGLAQGEAGANMIRHLALQVGQREIRLAVTSIGRAQQRK